MKPRLDLEHLVWAPKGMHSFRAGHADAASENAFWELALAGAPGQYALHRMTADGRHQFLRDALGVHKLFFGVDTNGGLQVGHYWHELLQAGVPQEQLWSVPPGYLLQVSANGEELQAQEVASLPVQMDEEPSSSPAEIRSALESCFQALGEAFADRPVYVALSGGLDSTAIAALAREYLPQSCAVTFALGEPGSTRASEDVDTAAAVARELDMEFATVVRSVDDVLASLDDVLLYGQDFRDFNVHCGLVNAPLAAGIAELHQQRGGQERPILLTGDTMNELMADYHAEVYRGQEFYRLPDLSLAQVRRLLVKGLDAGDREIGIFHHHGLSAIQPYALCAAAYTGLAPNKLQGDLAKQNLVQEVLGDKIPTLVYDRPKTRAQSGSADNSTGTLAACIDHGLDSAAVQTRFAKLYGLEPKQLTQFVRGGRYRFRTS
jgi:asparagine synthetase B (glutamine-hydrolysing)